MAWHVESPHASCPADEFAVVEDDDGEVHGCYATQAAADAEISTLIALNAPELPAEEEARPYEIQADHPSCPAGQFAVVEEEDDEVHGCYATVAAAQDAIATLTQLNPVGQGTGAPSMASARPPLSPPRRTVGNGAGGRSPDRPLREERTLRFTPEIRAENNADGTIPVAGYAAKFNVRSQPIEEFWGFRFIEQIAPGAFRKTLQEADVPLLINHNADYVLARNSAGSLDLVEDGTGLAMEARMTPTSYANDLAINMRSGNVDKMSFSFRVILDDWDETAEGTPLRTLREVKLYDVAIVTFPAYLDTEAALRSQQFAALMHATGLDRVPAAQRAALLSDLMIRDINPSRLPLLRAAEEALRDLAATVAPAISHANMLDVMARRHATYRLLMEAPT